jgi:hypothetical protein
MNITRTEAIKNFLTSETHADLASLYHHDMECQLNVAQDGGERIEGDYKGRQWHGWTDNLQTWKSFRIPWAADTNPEYTDSAMSFDLAAHAEGIGMTGWNWREKKSIWVAFDFDSISGHSKGLTDAELKAIQKEATDLPWITVRKSTSGTGLHLYIFLGEPVQTDNHSEHAALARSILGVMAAVTGHDFTAKVDAVGSNMWCWHRKMQGTDGLSLIKQGEKLYDIPSNWKDHVGVITGKRKKILPSFVEEGDDDFFAELAGQRSRVPLDAEHKKLITYLQETNASWWWDSDHQMLVAHTSNLADAHEALNCEGIFKTIAKGTQKGNDHNCFSGSTEVLTEQGPRKFKDLAKEGKAKLYVKTETGMRWMTCEIRSFGIQKTYNMIFTDCSSVRATKDHRWLCFRRDRKSEKLERLHTYELKSSTRLPLAPMILPEIDYEGYAHGFVFGDGSIKIDKRNGRYKETTSVILFKNDKDLLKTLAKFGNPGTEKCNGMYHSAVRELPKHWKELPENPTKEYALGFILGLISADGLVTMTTRIFQSNYDHLSETRKLAIFCGLRPGIIRETEASIFSNFANAKQSYTLPISTYNLSKDHFLRKDHQENFHKKERCGSTTISLIDWDNSIEEEVFCAVVPFYENFTLANGVITSNCFSFPLRRGAWTVRRYTKGCTEDPSWDQDGSGYTRTYFNRKPDLKMACRVYEGLEHPSGGFVFKYAELALKAAGLLGVNIQLPNWAMGRKTRLREHRDGRLLVDIDHESSDTSDAMQGWLAEKNSWKRIFNVQVSTPSEPETASYDDLVRHVVTEAGDDYGWTIRSDGQWRNEPLIHVRTALEALGLSSKEAKTVLGGGVMRAWIMVNQPFQPEYTGDRQWNRNAAQFRFAPSENKENLHYDNWLKILNHIGKGLDDVIGSHPWAASNGIKSGCDYLKCWLASLFQEPEEPLPYLFLYGPQNSGKSIFHEAVSLLITSGWSRADQALESPAGFNGELENTIFAIVEETDLRKNKVAYGRIKDWVTSKHLPIHRKNKTPYSVPNTLHFCHTSNDYAACPVFSGDTRVTMIYVPALDPIEMVPKKFFLPLLEKEASDFLSSLLSLEIPPSSDRLNVPVIVTEEKLLAEEANLSFLEMFLKEECHYVSGEMVKYGEFVAKFQDWLDPQYLHQWTKIRVGRELPPHFPKGRNIHNGHLYIGNMSFENNKNKNGSTPDKPKLILKDGKLISLEERKK